MEFQGIRGRLSEEPKRVVSKRVVLADVPRNENRNEGTFGRSPGTKNRNEGTFACSPGTKTGTRVHSPKPPFYETALLSPVSLGGQDVHNSSENCGSPGRVHSRGFTGVERGKKSLVFQVVFLGSYLNH